MKKKPIIFRAYDLICRGSLPSFPLLEKLVFKKIFWGSKVIEEVIIQTLRIFYAEPTTRAYCESAGKKIYIEKKPYINGIGSIILDDNITISGKIGIAFNQNIFPTRLLHVGSDTFIGHNCSFSIAKKITIGKHCYLAGGVRIMDNDGHPLDYLKRRKKLPVHKEDVKPVTIGNDVWIGRNAIILKGVTIGDRSIIAAGAIVAKNVASDSIAGGNPAQIIREINVC